MLDGYGLLNGMSAATQEAFWSVPTQKKGTGDGSQGCVWRSTNAKKTPNGRIFLRGPNGGTTTNRLDIDEPVAEFKEAGTGTRSFCCILNPQIPRAFLGVSIMECIKLIALIDEWRSAVIKAAPFAPRFQVAPGEVLLIDNYRMLHARDPYVGGRIMFRVHVWTDERMFSAMPLPCLCSCGIERHEPFCIFIRKCRICP